MYDFTVVVAGVTDVCATLVVNVHNCVTMYWCAFLAMDVACLSAFYILCRGDILRESGSFIPTVRRVTFDLLSASTSWHNFTSFKVTNGLIREIRASYGFIKLMTFFLYERER